ncbi:hypothetical protein [Tianweitania sediminis]|uniref:Uncharacterized protein n=1 Tax=Tianweitania sediminis TaxID=1502156 RepID=A0A8J7R0R7_9HYPH|nr:hypothetical protein [Tianweitania sediminis]MBP0437941.1 hypothetical protein [Tianweitania sediminis]
MHVVYHELYDRFAFTIAEDLRLIWSSDFDPCTLAPPPLVTGRLRLGLRLNSVQLRANLAWHRKQFWLKERRRTTI